MKIKTLNYSFLSLISDHKVIKQGKPVKFLTAEDKNILLKPLINIDDLIEKNNDKRLVLSKTNTKK